MIEELDGIANINGGGLSVEVTGKYTSVRHAKAKASGKMTAGEAAKYISKALKAKVSAKDVVAAHLAHFLYEAEWHHSGFYKGKQGSTMGRTYFFDLMTLGDIIDNWATYEQKKAKDEDETKAKKENIITGIFFFWDYDYSGRYGKKTNHKVLGVFKGSELDKPKNFTPCDELQYECAKLFSGKKYYGWDEPIASEFTKEKLDWELGMAEREGKAMIERDELQAKLKEQEYLAQFEANRLLNEIKEDLIAQGTRFEEKNVSWYIFNNFIPEDKKTIITCGKVKNWVCQNYLELTSNSRAL